MSSGPSPQQAPPARRLRRLPRSSGLVVSAAGVVLSGLLLTLALRKVELHQVRASLGGARPGYVAAAVACFALMYALQARRWWGLLNAQGSVSRRAVLGYVVGGIACNNVLPGRPGDLARVHWAARGGSIAHASSLATVVVDRAADVAVLAVALLLSLPLLGIAGWPLLVALTGLTAAGLTVAASAAARRWLARRAPAGPGRLGRLRRAVAPAAETLAGSLRPRPASRLAGLSVLAWGSWALAAVATARALGLELSLSELVFLTAVVNLGVAIPSSPGFVGTYQWLCVAALGAAGIGSAEALAFSVVLHAAWFVPTTVAGAGLLLAKVARMRLRRAPALRARPSEAPG